MSNRRHLEKRRRKYNQTLKPFVGFVSHSGWFLRYTGNPLAAHPIVVEPVRTQRRDNTYRDEAVDDWALGRRTKVVAYYGHRFVRYFDRGGWGEWEDIA